AIIVIVLNYILKFAIIIIGFKTIKIGADLIEQGAKGNFKLVADYSKFKTKLESLSPGLFFVLLGCILIAIALTSTKSYESSYFEKIEKKYNINLPDNIIEDF